MRDDANMTDRPDFRIARIERNLRNLERMTDRGMEIIDAVADRACADAKAPAPSPNARGPVEAYAQTCRAVRFNMALDAMFADYLAALLAGDPRAEFWPRGGARTVGSRAAGAEPDEPPEPYHFGPREDLRGNVLELLQADCMHPDERDRIYAGLKEGFYETERYDDFLDLPVVEAMNAICNDLGVEPDWSRLNGRGWPPWRRKTVPPEPAPPPEAEDPEPDDSPGPTPPHHPGMPQSSLSPPVIPHEAERRCGTQGSG